LVKKALKELKVRPLTFFAAKRVPVDAFLIEWAGNRFKPIIDCQLVNKKVYNYTVSASNVLNVCSIPL
jgi:hypothetical protein